MDIRAEIAAERRELARLLAGLPEEDWDAPSLCEGWRVREVVAHMTMPFRYGLPRFLLELAKAKGDFNRMADRTARRDTGTLAARELADVLERNADHPWKPPRGGFEGALTHDVVHGLDITVALGSDRRVPHERLRPVLDGLATPQGLKFFGADLKGVRLQADDIEWSFGSGETVSGPAQHLVLVLCGRRLPPGSLHGPPTGRYLRA